MTMKIWADADACPKIIKEIIFRAANRTHIKVILVANQPLSIPSSLYITTVQVISGFDIADNYIVNNMEPLDLVITADIPLADAVINNNGAAINLRGELYSKDNIKHRLAIRNLNESLRSSGVHTGGPSKFTQREVRMFANSLDRFLEKYKK